MSFKDIANIINEYTGEDKQVNKPEKSKDACAFELFLQGKQSVEVAIELDMPADKVEELHVQYWRLSKLDDLEILYHEAEYSLLLLLQLHEILKEKRVTKNKDICELIELANHGLPNLRSRFEELLNQVTALENERTKLKTENLGIRNSIYTNNEIIRKQHARLQTIDRKRRALESVLQNATKDSNYHKIIEIVDQRLNNKRSLLVAALIAVINTLKANPWEEWFWEEWFWEFFQRIHISTSPEVRYRLERDPNHGFGYKPYPKGIHETDSNKCVPGCRFYAPTGKLTVFDILQDFRHYQQFEYVWQAYKELEAEDLLAKE